MAIVHADDFEIYGRNAAYLTDGVYAQTTNASLVSDPDGVSSGTVVRFGDGTTRSLRFIRKVLSSAALVSGIAARYWISRIPVTSDEIPLLAQYRSAANIELFSITIDPSGRIQARTGGVAGAVIASTNNPVFSPNGWYHAESKLVVSPTEGSIEVRVEGRTVLLLDEIDTGTTPVQQAVTGSRIDNTVTTTFLKDLVIWDGSGSQNNDFAGTVLLQGLEMVADVDLNWSPVGAATGYEILSTKPPANSKYISAIDPPPPAYVGSMSQLPEDVTSVKGLVTYIRAAKIDGGDASLQVGLISSPDDDPETVEGADRPITVAQTYWLDVFEQDPKTLAPWTPQAVNAVNFKINRTT